MKELLLISPTFHGYHRGVAAGFESLGYQVRTHCYDQLATAGEKVRNKLRNELLARTGVSALERNAAADTRRRATARALEVLRSSRPDRVVVIKGDTLDNPFWDELNHTGVPHMLWLYDDLRRHDYTPSFLQQLGTVLSYSQDETAGLKAQGVNAHFVPNAFDPQLASPPTKRRPEAVFVGAHYPNREALLLGLQDAGVPVRAWGRGWSHHPIDRLRTWSWKRPAIPAERDVPLEEAYQVQAEGLVALNVHGAQAGLAMRTFEVPGMGGLQVVDRPDVSRFYEPDEEVLVFTSSEELVDLCRRAIADPQWAERIRENGRRRTLAEHTFAHRAAQIDELWT